MIKLRTAFNFKLWVKKHLITFLQLMLSNKNNYAYFPNRLFSICFCLFPFLNAPDVAPGLWQDSLPVDFICIFLNLKMDVRDWFKSCPEFFKQTWPRRRRLWPPTEQVRLRSGLWGSEVLSDGALFYCESYLHKSGCQKSRCTLTVRKQMMRDDQQIFNILS